MLTIGRTAENDIALPSKMVSRNHARLLIGPNGIIVEDNGSTNGCFVNGEQVKQHLMHDSDVLELGDLRYRLRCARRAKPRCAPTWCRCSSRTPTKAVAQDRAGRYHAAPIE